MKKQIKVILLLLCISAIQPVFAHSKLLTTLSDIFTLTFNKDLVLYPHIGVNHFLSKAHECWEKRLTTTLDDLIGQETARKEFEAIIDYILNYEKYTQLGIEPIHYLFLTGEPRSGKTFSVNCLAGSLKRTLEKAGNKEVRYFRITPADIAKCGGIKNIFSAVNHYSPAVVFIDELDMFDSNKTALNKYFETLTDFNQKNGNKIFLIVATNNLENINMALHSIGKLGKHIQLS